MSRRVIRVFIASPGDLAIERRAFKELVDDLNGDFGDGANLTFEPLAWEETLAVMSRRSQGLINQEIDRCDIFVLAMHRRWGQEAPDAQPYSSYTEEEFHRAYARWKETGTPTIFVFFKDIDPGQMADPGEQLKKVLAFRRHLEEQRTLLYRPFADVTAFKAEVNRHLRAYVRGDLPRPDAALEKVVLPLHAIEEIQKERAEKEAALAQAEREHQAAEAAAARADAFALEFAERAAIAALEGRVEEAQQDFAKATDGTTNMRVLDLASRFYYRTGNLSIAETLLERWLALSGRDAETQETAAACGNLGLIYRTRGELDRAEEMHLKSLAIEEKQGRQKGMAKDYGNLGLVYKERGELDRAEEMQRKALAINERLGLQEGMARQYSALGVIFALRGELDQAEVMHGKSLAINQQLGFLEGMAIEYGNLGAVYRDRGRLDLAEEMQLKSLAINEKLGRQKGMAIQCANLGAIYKSRGDLDRAWEFWTRSRDYFIKIGMVPDVKRVQDCLNNLSDAGHSG